jgi:undecaprenyl pyrophosphate phosphatase UppP
MLPISSSWHLKYFFQANSHLTHIYHIWLIPIVLSLLILRSRRQDFPSLWLMIASAVPSMFFYFGIKLGIVDKWNLPIEFLHLFIGLGLMLAGRHQYDCPTLEPSISPALTWVVMGLGQALGMRIPGSSRFGTSLLAGMFFKMDFRRSLVISFALDFVCLGGSAYLDVYHHTLKTPSFLELTIASLGFSIGWWALEKWQWHFISFLGAYRVLLSIGLFMRP